MAEYEPWPEAYNRILNEVKEEMPDATPRERYLVYRKRVALWKQERGIRLSAREQASIEL